MTVPPDLLAAQPFLVDLPARFVEELSQHATWSRWPAEHRLFQEGGVADRFWLIQSGTVALDVHVPGRGDVVVESLGPGQVLGWSWLFPPYEWHFGATVGEPTEAIELDGPAIRTLCDAQPELGYDLCRRFMHVLLDRLQATRVRLLDLYGSPLERTS
jgi:CRP/FNR family transcriptional regulator, cyclic AMP receptor protein